MARCFGMMVVNAVDDDTCIDCAVLKMCVDLSADIAAEQDEVWGSYAWDPTPQDDYEMWLSRV